MSIGFQLKGEEQARLKSFKIDNARIPLTLPVKRSVNIYDERANEIVHKNESVPFLIYEFRIYTLYLFCPPHMSPRGTNMLMLQRQQLAAHGEVQVEQTN